MNHWTVYIMVLYSVTWSTRCVLFVISTCLLFSFSLCSMRAMSNQCTHILSSLKPGLLGHQWSVFWRNEMQHFNLTDTESRSVVEPVEMLIEVGDEGAIASIKFARPLLVQIADCVLVQSIVAVIVHDGESVLGTIRDA